MPQTIAMTMLRTPLGEVLAGTSARGVCALEYPRPTRRRMLEARLRRWFPDAEIVETAPDPHAPIGDRMQRDFHHGLLDHGPLRLGLLAAACLAGLTGGAAAQAGSTGSAPFLVIRHATLLAGTTPFPGVDRAVLVEGSVVRWVGADADLRLPADAATLDVGGRVVIPGLIDLHQHAASVSPVPSQWLSHGVITWIHRPRSRGAPDGSAAGTRPDADARAQPSPGPDGQLPLTARLERRGLAHGRCVDSDARAASVGEAARRGVDDWRRYRHGIQATCTSELCSCVAPLSPRAALRGAIGDGGPRARRADTLGAIDVGQYADVPLVLKGTPARRSSVDGADLSAWSQDGRESTDPSPAAGTARALKNDGCMDSG